MSCPGNSQGDCFAADWARRVQNNGGARPSQATINAAGVFWNALETAGIRSKMKALNFIAPDSLIAAITPFIKGPGLDPWTNTAFVAGDLSVNGLAGNGSSKYLDTGFNGSTHINTSLNAGVSYYTPNLTGAANASRMVFGSFSDGGLTDFYQTPHHSAANTASGIGGWSGTNQINVATRGSGFYSANRTNNTTHKLYFAGGATAHLEIGSAAGAANTALNATCPAFAVKHAAAIEQYYTHRLSFLAVHLGLTESESSALYDAVTALRVALGGGYIPNPDDALEMATSWSARVIANGGAAPAAATVGAAETFYQALIDAGIHTKFAALNFIAPDSLIAARTPLIVGNGADPWSAVGAGWGAGNVTVDGVQPTGTNGEYWGTGVQPSTIAAMTTGSVGLCVYRTGVTAPGADVYDFGASSEGNTNILALLTKNGGATSEAQCWNFTGGAGMFQAANTPAEGWYSMQRTAANNAKIYRANSGTAHNAAGSTVNTGGGKTSQALDFMGLNIAGGHGFAALAAWRYSFAAILNVGLTQSEDLALYNAVQALRTTLGGGFV